jgi:hydroxymethylglutaryl-CoA lyase
LFWFKVGVRDGLQNEKKIIPVDVKVELAKRLVASGINYVEAGSFVSPKWVPQMAATDEVFAQLQKCNFPDTVTFAGLTPNMKGLEGAIASKVKEVAVFSAASEAFSMKNTNVSIAGSLERQGEVAAKALELGAQSQYY